MWDKMKNVIAFVKKETVLVIATILAVISAFFVKPGSGYLDYIDFRVLGILLSLMIIMAGWQKNGMFDAVGLWLLARTKNTVQLVGVLVFLCFFFSMIITNDVALLTFVPFAVVMLPKVQSGTADGSGAGAADDRSQSGKYADTNRKSTESVSLQPIRDGRRRVYKSPAPYTAISGLLFAIVIFVLGARKQPLEGIRKDNTSSMDAGSRKKNPIYLILFILSLLVVVRVIPYYWVLMLVLVVVFFMDRSVLYDVDYCLLLTFVSFFIFTGNMGNLPAVRDTLQNLVAGRELGIGILASQVVSNVPAALLLSGFTSDYKQLLLGVNIGGLGTLIASMASLISYKIYAHNYNRTKGIYLLWFTVANLLF